MINILSIDGGGIRGIISALFLAEIERCARQPIATLFDLIAGTSSGGVITLALTRPGDGGRPRYSAAEVATLWEEEGPRIFSRPLLHRILALGNLIEEKYPAGPLEQVLNSYLGDTQLRDALTEILIPTYEIERRTPVFFKSRRARIEAAYDFRMSDIARAASAAPTYFEPARIRPVDANLPALALIDGGVYANNPAMCAFAEARRTSPAADLRVISVGAGELTRPIPYEEAEGWGVINWAQPMLNVVFDGVSDSVDYQMRQLLPPGPDGRRRYYRFQTVLARGSDDLDDASPANLHMLRRLAEELIDREGEAIEALCAQLV